MPMPKNGSTTLRRLHLQPVCAWHGHPIEQDLIQFDSMTADDRAQQDALHETWKQTVCSVFGLSRPSMDKPFAFSDGVAIIPIRGTLINRFGGSYGSWVTGYNYIQRITLLADADPEVQLIVYDCDSHGGEAMGCPETAKIIAAAEKPTLAAIDSKSLSACYWLASQADHVVLISSGMTGSVGAMTKHVDYSEKLENNGIKVTLMRAGEHKLDGNPYGALPDDVRKATEARLNAIRQTFAEDVAKGRGMTVESVLATEANCYTAEEALSLGFVDEISTAPDSIQRTIARLSNGDDPFGDDDETDPDEEEPMTIKQTNTPAVTTPTGDETTTPTVDASAVATTERSRIKGILTHANASAQSSLAEYLAYDTDMSVAQCGEILSRIVKAETPQENAQTNSGADINADLLNAAMTKTSNPDIKPEPTESRDPSDSASKDAGVDTILSYLPADVK